MIRGSKTIAVALSILSITSSTTVFASEPVECIKNIEVSAEFTNEEDAEQEFNQLQNARLNARGVKETKLAGSDRYKTAVGVSKAGWSTSNKAILVQGNALADALTVAPLAEEYNVPILLTEKDKLNQDTLNELKRLGVKEITLIGSEGVISEVQSNLLKSQGFKVERIGGIDRIDTSVKVAYKLKDMYKAKGSTQRKTVFVANGTKGLADATSVASPAGMKDAVILYTNGTNLNGIKGYITSSADEVYLVGGTSVISQGVENELKNTTNKKITRLSGTDRKETNAKVVNEFFPHTDVNKVYIAKDGSGNEGELVDALAVGSLAGREKNPVIIASGDLSASQKTLIDKKEIKEVVQVGDGKNATAMKQAVGIINAVAQPEPEDSMRLPNITFTPEQRLYKVEGGEYRVSGQAESFILDAPMYVKYGDKTWGDEESGFGGHTYGTNSQSEYDKCVSHVQNALKTVNYRYEPEWVYMMHYVNGGKADNFVDPILQKKGRKTTYGQWKKSNSAMLSYISSGKLSKKDAEKLMIYNSALAHVERLTKVPTVTVPNGDAWSAYHRIFGGVAQDADSEAYYKLIIADVLGLNAVIMTNDTSNHFDSHLIALPAGNYWWYNGKTVVNKSNSKSPLLQTETFMIHMNGILNAPQFNMNHLWK